VGASQLFGVVYHSLPQAADGTFPLTGPKSLSYAIASRHGGTDPHYSRPALLSLENTHNRCGGAVLPQAWVDAAAAMAHEAGMQVHMDGARLFNAAAASPDGDAAASDGYASVIARLVRDCDTVSLCLSKGLGAPVGSVLVGTAAVIAKARRLRKALGGGMRQAGVLAAAGTAALAEQVPTLVHGALATRRDVTRIYAAAVVAALSRCVTCVHPHVSYVARLLLSFSSASLTDHIRAKALARGLAAIPGVILDAESIQTNIVRERR